MGIIDAARSQYSGGGGGGNFRKADLLVTVKGYDLEENKVLVERELPNGDTQAFGVVISKYSPKPTEPDASFEGNVIDARMADYLRVDSKIVLEAALVPKEGDIDPEKAVPVRWITATPLEPKKVITGAFTVTGYRTPEGRLKGRGVQQWQKTALDPAEMAEFKDLFDESHKLSVEVKKLLEAKKAGEADRDQHLPPVTYKPGFALRAVAKGPDGPEVVDFVPPMTVNPLTREPGSGYALSLSWEDVSQAMSEYHDYVAEEYGKDVKVEAIMIREYQASKDMGVSGPVGTMINTSCAMGPKQDVPPFGNAIYGVEEGIVLLSPGKVNARNPQERFGGENDWVNRFIANSAKAPIHTFIATTDGVLPKMNSVLELNYPTNPKRNADHKASHEEKAEPPATEEEKAIDQSVADDLGDIDKALSEAQEAEEARSGKGGKPNKGSSPGM